MNDSNGVPVHVNDFTPCPRCAGSGRAGAFKEFECGMCAGSGRDYGIKIVVESVTFAPAPKPRDLTHIETLVALALFR